MQPPENLTRVNDVFEEGLDEETAAATAFEISWVTPKFTHDAHNWGDRDELSFTGGALALGLVGVKVDGSINVGGYVADDYLWCLSITLCWDTWRGGREI